MRVIVTGAAGYIGSRLVKALEALGHEVAPVGSADRVDDLGGVWDVMYDLAWKGKGGALRADCDVQMANVKTALGHYSAAVRLGCSCYVAAGTVGEKMAEADGCTAVKSQNSVYVSSKAYLRRLLRFREEPACKVVWARLGNIYGGLDCGGNVVDWALRTVLRGEEAAFGPADQPYDFVYIDDAVKALVLLGTDAGVTGGEFYVGSGDVRALRDYLLELGGIAGRPELIGIGRRADDGTRYLAEWFDISALRRETGFSPETVFADGVLRLVAELKEAGIGS